MAEKMKWKMISIHMGTTWPERGRGLDGTADPGKSLQIYDDTGMWLE
jgi:hypothetical protein